jgi:UDP-N-acetyl-D-glucosamine dehydrogenase
VAYKKDIDDVRESPALSIIGRLIAKGADVRYHDSHVPELNLGDTHKAPNGEPLRSVELSDEELRTADCCVIVTDHGNVDYRRVCAHSKLIVDTRNALSRDLRKASCSRIVRL